MFGNQAASMIGSLIGAGMAQEQANAIAQVIGQCQANLVQRGSTDFLGPVRMKMPQIKGSNGDTYILDPAVGFTTPAGVPAVITLGNASTPVRKVKLTSDMTAGSASAQFWDWNGSAYAVAGDAFTVYDIFDRWWHAKTNDYGYVQYDPLRLAWTLEWANTSLIRQSTLSGGTLASGAAASRATAAGDTVYGDMVPSGKTLASGSAVTYYANMEAKRYIAISTPVCAL
jgi:hypothetical protein